MKVLLVAALLAASMFVASPAIAARTVTHYATANGYGAAAVRLDDGRVDNFLPHIYQALDVGLATPQLCYDAYLGIQTATNSRWLTTAAPVRVAALADANILDVEQREGSLKITTRWFAPQTLSAPALVAVVVVENTGTAAASPVRVPTLHNFHMGGGDGTTDERAIYDLTHRSFVETGARGVLVTRALVEPVNTSASPDDVFGTVAGGGALPTRTDSGAANDVVHAFTFAPPGEALAPGASFTFGVVFAYAEAPDGVAALHGVLDGWQGARGPAAILDDERADQVAHVAQATIPPGLSVDERALFGWSVAYLRAAQVRETGAGTLRRRPAGQIVAALPPGIWNITWLRDGMYAAQGLLDVGLVDAAAAALRFFTDGDAGDYAAYLGVDDYLLTVVRTYGGGGEESDTNASGPNVEIDGFGLFLRMYARLLDEGGDDGALAAVKTGVADVLVALIEDDGLLPADSSIWETHWTPSAESVGARRYAYTQATAAAGLQAFATTLQARGDPDGATYAAAAATLRAGITTQLVTSGGALAASVEEQAGATFLDAAVVEAFNGDVVDPRGAIADATLASLAALRTAGSPGYARNDEGGAYDEAEWIVVDMWLSRAFRREGNVVEADRLLAHVVQVGMDELGQLPELLDPATSVASGSTPMMGFGAGAYLTALADRARDAAAVDVDAGAPGDGGAIVDGGAVPDAAGTTDGGSVVLDGGSGSDAGGGTSDDGGSDDVDAGADVDGADGGVGVEEPACACGAGRVDAGGEPAACAVVVVGLCAWRRRRLVH